VLPDGVAADHPALRQKTIWRTERHLVLPTSLNVPVVFCGIARPEQFFAQVRAAGIVPAAEIAFRDHHAYNSADIQTLIGAARKKKGDGFLTTEKDAVNLGPLQADLQPFAVATLTITIEEAPDVVDAILARVDNRMPRS
jgi:tetraacyldisaccharide 4'-kinase